MNGAGQVVAAGRTRRPRRAGCRPAGRRAAATAVRSPARSTPRSWPRPPTARRSSAAGGAGRRPPPARALQRRRRGGPVRRRCSSTGWSPRSRRRCAGTCAWRTLRDLGVTARHRTPPAGTLTGLVERALPGRTDARAEDTRRPARRARPCSPSTPRPRPSPPRPGVVLVAPSARHLRRPRGRARPGVRRRRRPGPGGRPPAASSGSPRRTPASWWSGWSPTATRSARASRSPGCTPRRPTREHPQTSPLARPTPLATGTDGARLLGIGSYRPSRVVTNDEIAAPGGHLGHLDPRAHRHRRAPRRRAATRRSPTWRPTPPARRSPPPASTPTRLDLVVVATCSQEDRLPAAAPVVADRLGIPAPGAYDIQAACAGFCYALSNAADAIRERLRAPGPRDRRREAVQPHRLGRPLHLHPVGRRRGRGRGRPRRRQPRRPEPARTGGNGIGPVVWGSDGSARPDHPDHRATTRSCGWTARRCSAGRPPSSPRSPAAPARPPASSPPTWTRSSLAPGERPHHRRDRPVAAGRAGHRRVEGHRPRREHLGGVDPAGPVRPVRRRHGRAGGDRVLLLAFGAGLTYAGQVVRLP